MSIDAAALPARPFDLKLGIGVDRSVWVEDGVVEVLRQKPRRVIVERWRRTWRLITQAHPRRLDNHLLIVIECFRSGCKRIRSVRRIPGDVPTCDYSPFFLFGRARRQTPRCCSGYLKDEHPVVLEEKVEYLRSRHVGYSPLRSADCGGGTIQRSRRANLSFATRASTKPTRFSLLFCARTTHGWRLP